jgi:phosphoglycerol transferase MdoB-like AlkP superfamily enzyme
MSWGGTMSKGLSLLVVLLIAKLAILSGHRVEFSGWAAVAYVWQDVLMAMAFGFLDFVIVRWRPSRMLGWWLYAAAVSYVTINVAVARVLASPLTWQMLNSAGGTLSDSIEHHATPDNLAFMFVVALFGASTPLLLERVLSSRMRRARFKANGLIVLGTVIVLLGPLARSRVDTLGLERNAIVTLLTSALPHISTARASDHGIHEWRRSPIGGASAQSEPADLSSLRGAAAGRNVVLILLESAGARYLKPYGSNLDPMPILSKLSESSLLFDNAYSVYPESIKGLFSVLCSRDPAIDTATEDYYRIRTPSIAEVLRDHGYHTALFHSGRFMYLGMEAVVGNRGYEVLEDAAAISSQQESSFGVDEPSTVRRALAWVDSLNRGERFFLTYLPIAGHHPYETPEPGPFQGSSDSDRYLNALHYADQALGSILTGLRDRGLDCNTLFVIFGDHGEAFGQHDGNYGHSLLLYEENIHVPYLIAAPGLIREQERVKHTISLVDTAPTILDLVGLPLPTEYQGKTALDGRSRMALFYTDYSLPLVGLRDGQWKFIYELDSRRSKLYDLDADYHESKDFSASQPRLVAAYRDRLLEWSTAQKTLIKGILDSNP